MNNKIAVNLNKEVIMTRQEIETTSNAVLLKKFFEPITLAELKELSKEDRQELRELVKTYYLSQCKE